jgi:hypothetical protein
VVAAQLGEPVRGGGRPVGALDPRDRGPCPCCPAAPDRAIRR